METAIPASHLNRLFKCVDTGGIKRHCPANKNGTKSLYKFIHWKLANGESWYQYFRNFGISIKLVYKKITLEEAWILACTYLYYNQLLYGNTMERGHEYLSEEIYNRIGIYKERLQDGLNYIGERDGDKTYNKIEKADKKLIHVTEGCQENKHVDNIRGRFSPVTNEGKTIPKNQPWLTTPPSHAKNYCYNLCDTDFVVVDIDNDGMLTQRQKECIRHLVKRLGCPYYETKSDGGRHGGRWTYHCKDWRQKNKEPQGDLCRY
jgi:hypothetical protein